MRWLKRVTDWLFLPRHILSDLQRDIACLTAITLGQTDQLDTLKEILMATAEEVISRLDAATSEVADDLRDLKDELAAALADQDAAKQAAVDEALSKFDGPIARLESLGQDPHDPVPDSPADEEPEPGPDVA